jgi:hypothetical protein
MTRFGWGTFVFISVVAASCGAPTVTDPNQCLATCSGCCGADGQCLPGNVTSACGTGGARCSDCTTTGVCGSKNSCEASAAPGATCASAVELSMSGGSATATGNTEGVGDESEGSCGGAGGTDLVYKLTTPSVGTLRVAVKPTAASSNFKPVLYLRTSCDGATSERPGACAANPNAGGSASMVLPKLPAGTYFVVVDSASGSNGAFELTAALGVDGGDSCDSPIPLTFTQGTATGSGTLEGFADHDSTTQCGGVGNDLVYTFELAQTSNFELELSPRSADLTMVANLRSGTCTGTSVGCKQATVGGSALLRQSGLAAGTYFLFIDSGNSLTGPFTFTAKTWVPVEGELCSAPRPLTFSNGNAGGTASDTGDLTPMFNDTFGTCAAAGTSPDRVYSFTTGATLDLRATMSTSESSFRPLLYLRNSTCAGSERSCAIAPAAGQNALLKSSALPAGTYFLFADGAVNTTGPYSLSVELNAPVAGESCSGGAKPLTFSGGATGTATETGNTTLAFNDSFGSCVSAGTSSDRVYTFTTSSVLNLRAVATTSSSTFQPVLYLRTTCAAGQRQCVAATAAGGSATLNDLSLPIGTYFLWIDGANNTEGPFSLAVDLTPPPVGDTCSNPKPLTFSNGPAGGTVSDTASTLTFANDSQGSCGGGSAPDHIYSFTTNALLDLRASVSTTTSGYQPVLYLRNAACAGAERLCTFAASAGATASLATPNLPAGTYFLWVDGGGAVGGNFTLNASLTAPVVGDTCASPKTLGFTNGQAGGTVSEPGDTTTYFHDTTGTCSTGLHPDAIYTFTTNATLDLRVTATPTSSALQPSVYLRSSSCTGVQQGCGLATAPGSAGTLAIGALAAGTYYLVVDGHNGTAGPYTLNASLTAPVAGDSCSGPKALNFVSGSASDTGDTSTLFHETSLTCAPGTAPDAIYSFTTASVLDLRVSVTPTGGTFQPAISLRTSSCLGTQQACGAATAGGAVGSISVGALPIGTYYLVVDGANNTAGAYSLSATLTTPVPGEACSLPKALTFTNGGAGGTATVSGDGTGTSFNDTNGTCGGSSGADLVYSFTTTAPRLDLIANVTPSGSGSLRPVVYLRSSSCTAGVELGCTLASAVGASASVTAQGLTPGTYYLWVDGEGTAGTFNLSATLSAPPPVQVRSQPIANVVRPGPMAVSYELVDRYGNRVTTHATTTFTVGVSGSATVTGATNGSILSGSGTNSVVVQMASGLVTLSVQDPVAETVSFSTVNTQPNTLSYPGADVSVTAAAISTPCQAAAGTLTFTTNTPAAGPGTLVLSGRGDFGSSSIEYLTVRLETATGTNYGNATFVAQGDCSASNVDYSISVPQVDLNSFVSDATTPGVINVHLTSTSSVGCTCAGATVSGTLSYAGGNRTGTFTP